MLKEAIILAGGEGTRLQSVVSQIPKPMAPINEIPFLTYLLNQCKSSKIKHVVLSVGYKYSVIKDYFGSTYEGIELTYAIEKEKLGTGGAIKYALKFCVSENILILNGDSIFNIDLNEFHQNHILSKKKFSLAIKPMVNFDRYGSVSLKNNNVVAFKEKQYCKSGHINTGVYLLNKACFLNEKFKDKFSFEDEFLSKYVGIWSFGAYANDAFFIDIGIPEDYYRAQKVLGTDPS